MKALYAIVGMKHRGTEALVASLPAGTPLTLEREPGNEYDRWAIKVVAKDVHVGYVRAAQSRQLGPAMDARKTPMIAGVLRVSGDRWPMAEVDE